MGLSNSDAVIDRLSLLIDKIYCSWQAAIKNGFVIHYDVNNITYTNGPVHRWVVHPAVRDLQPGDVRRRTTPYSHMVLGRTTVSCSMMTDIDRMLCMPTGVMNELVGGFRNAPRDVMYALDKDSRYDTKMYTYSRGIGLCLMNSLLGTHHNINLPMPLVKQMSMRFDNAVYT